MLNLQRDKKIVGENREEMGRSLLSTDRMATLQYRCVCVFFPFILDVRLVGRTSRGHTGGRSHTISHPPSFCGACLNFSREKDAAILLSLVNREVEFCVLTILTILIVLHLLGILFYFLFYFFRKEKSQLPGFELTSQRDRLRGYQLSYRGDRRNW